MVVTNDPLIANHLVRLRSHGVTRDFAEMTQAPDGPWYYQQLALGYNYRMTEIQAALGLSQMNRLDEFVAKRHALALEYNELLVNEAVTTPWQHPDNYSAMHLYIIRLRLNEIEYTHREVFERLRVNGIGVNLHYIPVYRHPYYAQMGFDLTEYPEAERYYTEAISLPMYSELTNVQQREVVKHLITPIGHQTIF
jgi:dTDP-4-amino-4,6-dideoxygalactose transaminase